MPTTINGSGITFPDTTSTTTNLIPAGTKMLFRQAAAPTGWTRDTTNFDNHAIRIVTGIVGSGGNVNFTDAFAAYTPGGNITFSGTATTGSTATAGTISSASTGISGTATNTNITPAGSVGGAIASATIPVSPVGSVGGTTGDAVVSVSGSATSGSASVSGTTDGTTVTSNLHTHTVNPLTTFVSGEPANTQVLTGVSIAEATDTTNSHTHTFNAGSHTHSVSITAIESGNGHRHDIFLYNNGSHNHGFSSALTFTGTTAGHTHSLQFTDNGHSHNFSGTSHNHSIDTSLLGPNFAGTSRSFAVKYIDCIFATKDA